MNHVLTFLKGMCMGAADVVPGVSGGTVALLVGIFERLIRAISSFDREWIGFLRARKIREALDHIDWQFLLALGMGLVTGFIITVKTLAHYLEDDSTRTLILAAFFGMILAATIIVARMVRALPEDKKSSAGIDLATAGVGLAIALGIYFWQLGRGAANEDLSYWYLFICGAVGICAMILPGISGALILILMGVYEPLVSRIKAFLKFEDFGSNLLVCICFGLGALTGLALFSRVLRKLLDKYTAPTLSLLCGLMAGSLPFLWPFQVNTTPGVEKLKERIYEPVWPEALDGNFWKHVAVAAIATGFVLVAEMIGSRLSQNGNDRLSSAKN